MIALCFLVTIQRKVRKTKKLTFDDLVNEVCPGYKLDNVPDVWPLEDYDDHYGDEQVGCVTTGYHRRSVIWIVYYLI